MTRKTMLAKPIPGKAKAAGATTKRVTIRRRAHEYDHQYGLPPSGRAAAPAKKVAKSSKRV